MRSIRKLSTATSDTLRQELLAAVEHLLESLRRGAEIVDALQEVYDLLAALPLATDDYQTANNRLRNARRYLVSLERGAARYELSLLAGSLRPREDQAPRTRLPRQPGS